MDDVDRKSAREGVEVPWDELREARNLKEVLAARARERQHGEVASASSTRRWGWWVACAGAVGLIVLAVVIGMQTNRGTRALEVHAGAHELPETPELAPTIEPPSLELDSAEVSVLTLPDGGHVRLQPGARIELVEQGVVQRSGRARYTITHERARPLELTLDKVSLRVAAAVFEAAIDVHHVELTVFEGRVELREDGRWVALEHGGEAHIPREPQVSPSDPPPRGKPRPEQPATPSAAELMERADQARAEGRIDDAVAELRALLEQHGQSPHVGAALFTLARLESNRGHHEIAAEVFAEHSRRFPNDPLAEDALAGAATHSDLAGATSRAREHAEDYLERFPVGIHRATMNQLIAED